jgi:hypothetical protein
MSCAVALVVTVPIAALLAVADALPPVVPEGPANESADATAVINCAVDAVPVAVAVAVAAPGVLPDILCANAVDDAAPAELTFAVAVAAPPVPLWTLPPDAFAIPITLAAVVASTYSAPVPAPAFPAVPVAVLPPLPPPAATSTSTLLAAVS